MKVRKYAIQENASSINEDAIFGASLEDAPNAVLNDPDNPTVIGPDGKAYNMEGIRDNVKFIYSMIVKEYPALSYFLALLQPVYTFDVPTMATDGYHIFINPKFYVELQTKKPFLAPTFVILHELYHNLLCHAKREEQRGGEFPSHTKCNLAQDHEINNLLEDQDPGFADITQLIGGYCDKQYRGMIWENIYPLLKDDPMQNQPQVGQGGGGGQSGQGNQQQSQGSSQGGAQGQGDNQGQGSGSSGQSGNQGQAGQGQGSGNDQQQGNQGNGSPQVSSDSVNETDSSKQGGYSDTLSKAQGEQIAKRAGVPYTDEQKNNDAKDIWKRAIEGKQGDNLKDMPSNGQGGSGLYERIRQIREMFKPTQDWRKLLAKYMNDAFMEEDVKFPQKKYISSDRYKRYEDEIADGLREVCMMYDVSGSVWGTSGAFEQFISEINSIFKKVHISDGTIVQFADGIEEKNIFKFKKRLKPEAFNIKNSGGTNYNAALTWANDYYKKKMPGCVILFTDADITYTDLSVHYRWMDKKLIWFIIDSGNYKEKILERNLFGKVIIVDQKDIK